MLESLKLYFGVQGFAGRETPVQPLPENYVSLVMGVTIGGQVGPSPHWYRYFAEKKRFPLPWDLYQMYEINTKSSKAHYIGVFGPNPSEIDGQVNGLVRKPDKQGSYSNNIKGRRQHPAGIYYLGVWWKNEVGIYTIGINKV